MKDIMPEIIDDGKIIKEVYESIPLAYSLDGGVEDAVAVGLDDSVVVHSAIGGICSDAPTTYTVITERATGGAVDYNPDDYSDFFIPGQQPVYGNVSSSGNFDYSSTSSVYSFKNTDSSVKSGGRGVTSSTSEGNKSHAVDRTGDYITRDIKNTKATSVNLSERVKIVPGNVGGTSSVTSLVGGAHGNCVTLMGNLGAGQKFRYGITVKITITQADTYTVDFKYASYLKALGQSFSRGTATYNIERLNGNALGGVVKTLLTLSGNVGTRTHINNLSNYHAGSKSASVPVYLTPGTYGFVIRTTDTYVDKDADSQGYPFYAWGSADILHKKTSTVNDSTYALAELINLATGQVIKTSKVYSDQVFNYSVPKGAHYRVRYTLIRGNGKSGGLNGSGGSLYVYGGTISQDWQEYTFKDPQEEFPYTPPGIFVPPYGGSVDVGSPGGGVTIPAPSIYCWLDYFRLYNSEVVEPKPDCFGNDITVEIKEGNSYVDSYVFDDSDRFIEFSVENTSSVEKVYSISFIYDHDCEGDPPIYLYGGKFTFDETRAPDASSVSINGLYAEQEKDIWYGAEGSKLQFNVYDKLGDLVRGYTWDTNGEHGFDVTNLGHLPYSNYRAEFITTQRGEISPVTNIDYRAEFFIDDFKALELWKPTPLPFNSVLEFYIDDVLVGRWGNEGSGVFKHSVPKGKHTYKWVLINKNSENTWDFAEIDWFRLTNWICDAIIITPYCEPGRGDEAVEALIKCLLEIWRQRPDGCVFGNKKIWLFT